jgi:hypothetical protein
MLPAEVVSAYIEEELPGARAWADREGLELSFDPERSSLLVELAGPGADGGARERYLLEGMLDDYRALPPLWRFLHPDSGEEVGAAGFPAAPATPPGNSSILIPNPTHGAVICAHFSRRAYTDEGGPHGEWGGPSQWETIREGQVVARTLGDMLHRIHLEVAASPGRMAPLP